VLNTIPNFICVCDEVHSTDGTRIVLGPMRGNSEM
jgi:hypothetical protein